MRYTLLAVGVLFCAIANAAPGFAQDLDERNRAALKEIRETAADICLTVQQSGQQTAAEISGKIDAKLNGVISKFVDLGVEGAGKLNTDEYKGVIRDALAPLLKDNINCRRDVFDKLVDKMLTPLPKPDQAAPQKPSQGMQREEIFKSFDVSSGGNQVRQELVCVSARGGGRIVSAHLDADERESKSATSHDGTGDEMQSIDERQVC